MQKKFEINWAKIKGGCQSERKVATHNSKSDLLLIVINMYIKLIKPKLFMQVLLTFKKKYVAYIFSIIKTYDSYIFIFFHRSTARIAVLSI